MSILYFNEWGMRIKIYYKKINKKDLTNHLEYCILILHAKIGSEKEPIFNGWARPTRLRLLGN